MRPIEFEPVPVASGEVAANIGELKALFPEVFSEGSAGEQIDWAALRAMLGRDHTEDPNERFGLNWSGKREAKRLALTASAGTLRPQIVDSADWATTKNLMIEGDNLETLKLLQKSYSNSVKMIYIDPPYNTGRDFVYPDNFRDTVRGYLELTGQVEGGMKLTSNTESGGRFHTEWLNMMYPRIKLAKNLLREDGVLFIQIGEGELANLKLLCDEIFGEECNLGIACRVAKKSNNKGDYWAPNFDYILTYAKDRTMCPPFSGGANTSAYNLVDHEGPRAGELYQLVRLYMSTIANRNPEQRFWIDCPDGSKVIPPGSTFPPDRPNLGDGIWRWSRTKFNAGRDRIVVKRTRSSNLVSDTGAPAEWNVFTKTYLNDVLEKSSAKPNNLIEGQINQIGSHELNDLAIPFDYPKPTTLVEFLMQITKTQDDDIVLDFFAGSGSTGHAVMKANAADGGNRRFVLVQLPEPINPDDANQRAALEFCDSLGVPRTLAELTKERLRRAALKVGADNPLQQGDDGFRVFKLDSSNIRPWYPDPTDLTQTLLDNRNHVLPGRSDMDLLFEVLLRLGHEISLQIEERQIAGKTVYSFGEGALLACMSPSVLSSEVDELVQGISEWHVQLGSPATTAAVFLDSGFVDDIAKTNLLQALGQSAISTVRTL